MEIHRGAIKDSMDRIAYRLRGGGHGALFEGELLGMITKSHIGKYKTENRSTRYGATPLNMLTFWV